MGICTGMFRCNVYNACSSYAVVGSVKGRRYLDLAGLRPLYTSSRRTPVMLWCPSQGSSIRPLGFSFLDGRVIIPLPML